MGEDEYTVRDLHTVAMVLAQEAMVRERRGEGASSVTRLMRREASRLERLAIAKVDRHVAATGEDPEPTRRILTISAISLEHYPSTEEQVLALAAAEEKRGAGLAAAAEDVRDQIDAALRAGVRPRFTIDGRPIEEGDDAARP